jgi:hypothetical protein
VPDPDEAAEGIEPARLENEPEPKPSTPCQIFKAKLGHDLDAPDLIDQFVEADGLFEAGNNLRSGQVLDDLLSKQLSSELRGFAETARTRIRPDRFALILLAVCLIGILIIWLAATSAGKSPGL